MFTPSNSYCFLVRPCDIHQDVCRRRRQHSSQRRNGRRRSGVKRRPREVPKHRHHR